MAKKKDLRGLDQMEAEFINEKMKASSRSIDKYIDGDETTYRSPILDYKVTIKCKTEAQKEFLNLLKDKKKEICFGIGSPGSGKSFISLGYALKELKSGRYDTITMVIPTAPAGGEDLNLGFLKGTLLEKTEPFKECDKATITKILKLSGNADPSGIANQLINSGLIKYEFINFLLGKTIDNSIILVNEAEQYTKDNLRLILTRIGENSKFVITGDILQTNRRSIVKKKEINGLEYASEKLSDLEEVGITEFKEEDIVRNPLISKILDRWE